MPEELLVSHCAPTLAGLKTANLFSCSCPCPAQLAQEVTRLNKQLNSIGVCVQVLSNRGKRALIYVYRPKRLEKDLNHPDALCFLKQCGYQNGCALDLVQQLQEKISLLALPMLGTVPSLHWTFCDRTGESIVVEPDGDGLHIYRRTIGVMTNSPSYSWHRLNLLNYVGLRDLDYDAVQLCGDSIPQCFSGSGMQGLPGDFSSPSRFVRLAMLKKCAVPGQNETDGVAKLFHLMQSAAFPLGAVRVSEPGHVTERDEGVVPFDYTLYTVVLCAQSLRCYWTSYENQRVQYLELERLLERSEPVQFDFRREPDFLCRNEG